MGVGLMMMPNAQIPTTATLINRAPRIVVPIPLKTYLVLLAASLEAKVTMNRT